MSKTSKLEIVETSNSKDSKDSKKKVNIVVVGNQIEPQEPTPPNSNNISPVYNNRNNDDKAAMTTPYGGGDSNVVRGLFNSFAKTGSTQQFQIRLKYNGTALKELLETKRNLEQSRNSLIKNISVNLDQNKLDDIEKRIYLIEKEVLEIQQENEVLEKAIKEKNSANISIVTYTIGSIFTAAIGIALPIVGFASGALSSSSPLAYNILAVAASGGLGYGSYQSGSKARDTQDKLANNPDVTKAYDLMKHLSSRINGTNTSHVEKLNTNQNTNVNIDFRSSANKMIKKMQILRESMLALFVKEQYGNIAVDIIDLDTNINSKISEEFQVKMFLYYNEKTSCINCLVVKKNENKEIDLIHINPDSSKLSGNPKFKYDFINTGPLTNDIMGISDAIIFCNIMEIFKEQDSQKFITMDDYIAANTVYSKFKQKNNIDQGQSLVA